jgi:hypothetical protein
LLLAGFYRRTAVISFFDTRYEKFLPMRRMAARRLDRLQAHILLCMLAFYVRVAHA